MGSSAYFQYGFSLKDRTKLPDVCEGLEGKVDKDLNSGL